MAKHMNEMGGMKPKKMYSDVHLKYEAGGYLITYYEGYKEMDGHYAGKGMMEEKHKHFSESEGEKALAMLREYQMMNDMSHKMGGY